MLVMWTVLKTHHPFGAVVQKVLDAQVTESLEFSGRYIVLGLYNIEQDLKSYLPFF